MTTGSQALPPSSLRESVSANATETATNSIQIAGRDDTASQPFDDIERYTEEVDLTATQEVPAEARKRAVADTPAADVQPKPKRARGPGSRGGKGAYKKKWLAEAAAAIKAAKDASSTTPATATAEDAAED